MSVNKIPAIILDISENVADVHDISVNKIPAIILDVPTNRINITDISTNKISAGQALEQSRISDGHWAAADRVERSKISLL